MNPQINNTQNQISQHIEAIAQQLANQEKAMLLEAADRMIESKVQSALSQARSEAIHDIHRKVMTLGEGHLDKVANHLTEQVLTSEQNNPITEAPKLDWSLKPRSLGKSLEAARESETNMRLIASESEVTSWLDGE